MEEKDYFIIKHHKEEIYLDKFGGLTFKKNEAYNFKSKIAAELARHYYKLFNYMIV